jgi:hypothetical protein
LFQSGYLVQDFSNKKVVKHLKIPNCEVQWLFGQKLKEYLNFTLIQSTDISNLSKAVIAEDFEIFGIELAKSLRKNDESEQKSAKAEYIYSLMLKLFDHLNSNSKNKDGVEIYDKLGKIRSRMQFNFGNAEKEGKTYYIIQLDEMYSKEDYEIENRVIERLESIFNLDYHQNILETGETATIIMMGMAAPLNKVCLATLKLNISDGRITQATTIKHQRFLLEADGKNAPEVKLTKQKEYSINIAELEKKACLNAIEKESTELYNKKLKKEFVDKIYSLRGRIKKYHTSYRVKIYKKFRVPTEY